MGKSFFILFFLYTLKTFAFTQGKFSCLEGIQYIDKKNLEKNTDTHCERECLFHVYMEIYTWDFAIISSI